MHSALYKLLFTVDYEDMGIVCYCYPRSKSLSL